MIQYVLNGTNYTMPLTMLTTLGHSKRDREIAASVLIHNGWLFGVSPGLAMYLRLL